MAAAAQWAMAQATMASAAAGGCGRCRAAPALFRPLGAVLGAPPALARGKFTGEAGSFGAMRPAESTKTSGQPFGRAVTGTVRSAGFDNVRVTQSGSMHHEALRRISEQRSLGDLVDMAGGPLQVLRDRSQRLRRQSDQQQQEDIFLQAREFLMEPKMWTFGNMMAYQRKVLELAGGTGWRRRLSSDDPSILHLEKELRVLEAMTPSELLSNHKRVFTPEAKKLIAEKASVTERYVDQVILEHDILRADRRWYMILIQFQKPLPKSFEDRQYMAEYDRPLSESELEYQEEMLEKHRRNAESSKPPRFHHIWFRHPTCGGNRWSTRPPRWYPAQWKMRPERRERLGGVGVPGGGGDRGRPWGRLGAHFGGGGGSGGALTR